jgi:ankyrin repeat protein
MQVPFPALPAPARLASQDGSTPLLTAAYNGHAEVVDRLIAARAEVDAANKVMPSACHATTRPYPPVCTIGGANGAG